MARVVGTDVERAVVSAGFRVAFGIVFDGFEVWEDVVPTPASAVVFGGPAVEVFFSTANPDGCVECVGSAEDLAARDLDLLVGGVGLWGGSEVPVVWPTPEQAKAGDVVDVRVGVLTASFYDGDGVPGVEEAAGDDGAC